MSASASFIEQLKEHLGEMGPVTVRRMFGGAGVYADDLMFALIADDVLYFKADDETRAAFEAEGMEPFVYAAKGKPIAMSYWRAPDRLFDDPGEMAMWGRNALGAARRAKKAKSSKPLKPRRRVRRA